MNILTMHNKIRKDWFQKGGPTIGPAGKKLPKETLHCVQRELLAQEARNQEQWAAIERCNRQRRTYRHSKKG